MPRERKKGQLRLEGANPMTFVESNDEPVDDWTPEQEAASTAVSEALRSYIKSLENLAVAAIDLQQLHVWSDAWAADEGWQRAAEDLKRQKLIRGFGISVNRWQPANVLQALRTGAELMVLEWCDEQRVTHAERPFAVPSAYKP